jgi:DNA repair ATPase RecN
MQQPEHFSDEQRSGLDARRADLDRTLAAMHVLEAALSRAAFGREAWWQEEVRAALGALADATADETNNANAPDSLLSDVAFRQPRLRNRVRSVRLQYAQLRDAISALHRELELVDDDEPEVADVRQRLALVLTALRHLRERESDLIYEAYYDAFERELDDL